MLEIVKNILLKNIGVSIGDVNEISFIPTCNQWGSPTQLQFIAVEEESFRLPCDLIVHGTGYVLNLGLLYCGVSVLDKQYLTVQAAAVFAVAGTVYLLLDRFVSPKKRPGDRT